MPRLSLPALALLAGCALDHTLQDGGAGLRFTVGTMEFRVSSGGVKRTGNVLIFYFTDQPDACLAVTQVPVGLTTILALQVQPGDTTSATVVAHVTVPGPGQAAGSIATQVGGQRTGSYDVASGTAAWTVGTTGAVTVDGLDLGFDGVAGRVTLAGYTLPTCQ